MPQHWATHKVTRFSGAMSACETGQQWRDALRLLDKMGAADDDADADDDGVDVAAALAAKKGKGEGGEGEAEQEVGNAVALFGPVRVRANEYHIGLAMKTLLGAGKTKEVWFELGPGLGPLFRACEIDQVEFSTLKASVLCWPLHHDLEDREDSRFKIQDK